jgi:hypothetical protein
MSANTLTLPSQFADLARFAPVWALKTEQARHENLLAQNIGSLRTFYDAMLPRMDEITVYLNQFPLDAMPADAQALFDLAMTFMESAHPIDLRWRTTDIEDKFPSGRFEFLSPSNE